MLQETFCSGNSIFHRADPRIKIILLVLYIFAIVLNNSIISVLILFVFSLIFVCLSKVSIWMVFKRLFVVNTFVLFLWFFLPFSTPGETVFTIYKLKASMEGITEALLITIKANGAILAIITYVSTTTIPMIGHALYKLGVSQNLVLLFLLTYRYLDVIFDEFSRMYNAAIIRNFIPKTNIHTYKTISYMVAMVLIRAYERGKRIYEAMLLRGFNGKFSSLQQLKLTKNDLLISYLTLFSIVLSFVPQYICYLR